VRGGSIAVPLKGGPITDNCAANETAHI